MDSTTFDRESVAKPKEKSRKKKKKFLLFVSTKNFTFRGIANTVSRAKSRFFAAVWRFDALFETAKLFRSRQVRCERFSRVSNEIFLSRTKIASSTTTKSIWLSTVFRIDVLQFDILNISASMIRSFIWNSHRTTRRLEVFICWTTGNFTVRKRQKIEREFVWLFFFIFRSWHRRQISSSRTLPRAFSWSSRQRFMLTNRTKSNENCIEKNDK